MYDYLEGELIEAGPHTAVLDVNGVGYKLLVPVDLMGKLPPNHARVKFYTTLVTREDAQTLYGFLQRTERDLFETLFSLSGIGPKTALAVIGHLSMEELGCAIRMGDAAVLSRVPGIGKKSAERLLVDLKGKKGLLPQIDAAPSPPIVPGASHVQDALRALINLGYSQASAKEALKSAVDQVSEEADLSTLIQAALKVR